MTDTHTHIYMTEDFPDGGESAVRNAINAGVTRMVFPCVTLDSLEPMRNLHQKFPAETRIALGLHPTEIDDSWQDNLNAMQQMLPGDFCAIGEVGIDLYHDSSRRQEQIEAFKQQLEWAAEYRLPLIIHCREGLDDTLQVLEDFDRELPSLVFHSFTGTVADVKRIRTVCDPWFGINGVVTFKNAASVRDALPEIGIEKILLETDAPWLSPAPFRGRLNESARIPLIRDCVAQVLNIDPLLVEKITDMSAAKIFKFN